MLLDSGAAQANRLEEALLKAVADGLAPRLGHVQPYLNALAARGGTTVVGQILSGVGNKNAACCEAGLDWSTLGVGFSDAAENRV